MTDKLEMDMTAMNAAISDARMLVEAADSQQKYTANDSEIKAENFGTLPDGQTAGGKVVAAEAALAKSFTTLHQYVSELVAKLEATEKTTSETEADNQWKFVTLMQAG